MGTPPGAGDAPAVLKRATATVDCPKSMVGRVIGKSGETIKALQTYTGALIQIDQTVEPTKVTISGTPHSLSLAVSMVTDIVKGTFKGFALLRQITNPGGVVRAPPLPTPVAQPRPVYAPGYGLIPPSQLYGADERTAGVVPVNFGGRAQPAAAAGWPAGQVTPSQMILNMPGGMMRPMGQQGLMGDDGMLGPMAGYGGGMAMAYAYPPDPYAMQGMMQAPEVMYGDPSGMMAAAAGGLGSQARLYHAAGGKGGAPGGRGGSGGDKGGGDDMLGGHPQLGGHQGGGQFVQVMDPEGKVYYLPQGQQ